MATCSTCAASLGFVRMESGKSMPVNGPDPAGTVAAKRVGGRYQQGYIVTKERPLAPGFVPLQAHWATCDKTEAHRKRAAATKPTQPGPALF